MSINANKEQIIKEGPIKPRGWDSSESACLTSENLNNGHVSHNAKIPMGTEVRKTTLHPNAGCIYSNNRPKITNPIIVPILADVIGIANALPRSVSLNPSTNKEFRLALINAPPNPTPALHRSN